VSAKEREREVSEVTVSGRKGEEMEAIRKY